MTKEPFNKEYFHFLGKKTKDWSYGFGDGWTWTDDSTKKFYKSANTNGSIIECIIDRVKGTLSYVLTDGEKVTPFTEKKEFTSGKMYFAVSLYLQDYAFEIVD